MEYDLVVDRFARLHQRMRNPVGLHEMRAEGDKHLSYDRLAGRDASGQANFQHEPPRNHSPQRHRDAEKPFLSILGFFNSWFLVSGFLCASVTLWLVFIADSCWRV